MSENNIFSYTKRDYDSARKEGLAKIPILSNGVWTDLNASDPGVIILDYVHALVDMVQYYQDHQALESFITTAKERPNIFRLAKQMAYKINSATCAEVYVKFTPVDIHTDIIKIPKNTILTTRSNIQYMTVEDTYLGAGEKEVYVLCRQGTVASIEYTGTGISRFSQLNDESNNQSITLTTSNIDISTISIVESSKNNRTWEMVDSIVFSKSTDRVYQADLNADGSITISFGDGERGVVPQTSDKLVISYVVTEAENGMIGIGDIDTLKTSIYDSRNIFVEFSVTNEEESVGGSSPQSSKSIRDLAPGAIKAQDRAVTISDFENLAKLVNGVSDAKAYDINIDPEIPHQEVRVVIIPTENNSSKLLLTKVYNYLYERMIPPTNLIVSYPSPVEIDIDIVVKSIGNVDPVLLEYQIEELINSYFENRRGEIGEDFYPTDLSTEVSKLDSVKYIVSMTPSDIVTIVDRAVSKLGNINITVN